MQCLRCKSEATWMRCTQFAGNHPYCLEHAEKESDFKGKDKSYFSWKKVRRAQKVVLTGAPHSGKSTLIRALSEKGYSIVPEAAMSVISSLTNLIGPSNLLKWRGEHAAAFQNLIDSKQLYMEGNLKLYDPSIKNSVVFLDRGIYDGLAFKRHFTLTGQSSMRAKLAAANNLTPKYKSNYDKVFLLDLVLPFKAREETGRIESEEDCRILQSLLEDVYIEVGLKPIKVPLMSVEDRLKFILEAMGV